MADPNPYNPSYDFSDFETSQPSTPKPGAQLDIQFADISDAILSHVNAIKDVRRSDGALKNGIVTEDSLAVDLVGTITAETAADAAAAQASADAAAASAVGLAAAEVELAAAAAQLAAVAEIVAAGGYFGDYGSITEAAGAPLDYGSIA